ncbi:MAG: hypothetical protein IPO40_06165 [Fibrobacteres bacterium]|nr:hypothetical protein [Fibrobacterota bacterium]
MLDVNKRISFPGDDVIEMLREVNIILISLREISDFYLGKDAVEYANETNRFIDEWRVTRRLAIIRKKMEEQFDSTRGSDDLDDLERAFDGLKYWEAPGDQLSNEELKRLSP